MAVINLRKLLGGPHFLAKLVVDFNGYGLKVTALIDTCAGGNAFVTPRIAKKLKYHRRASSEQLPEDMPIVRLGGKPGLVMRGWALGTKPDHRQPMRNSMPDVRNGHWQQRRDIGAQVDGETCRISKSKDKADYAAAQGLGIAGIGIATIDIVDA
ncbi:hypothetical protein E4U40_006318 [Claviceps sp. LM458 group G5]|nr:hypothetical protein E4U40_006318 [Claviceps sp. LM458 group G5]